MAESGDEGCAARPSTELQVFGAGGEQCVQVMGCGSPAARLTSVSLVAAEGGRRKQPLRAAGEQRLQTHGSGRPQAGLHHSPPLPGEEAFPRRLPLAHPVCVRSRPVRLEEQCRTSGSLANDQE